MSEGTPTAGVGNEAEGRGAACSLRLSLPCDLLWDHAFEGAASGSLCRVLPTAQLSGAVSDLGFMPGLSPGRCSC